MELLTQGLLGGVLAILVLREVFNFLSKNKLSVEEPKKSSHDVKLLYDIKNAVDDLHEWHNQKDSDGVYVWYVRRSLEEAISRLADSSQHLADSIKLQTAVLDRIASGQEELRKDLEAIKREK